MDFTVLDPHWGTLADWQNTIDAIHARGMYIMADFTVGTMGDLVGFEGYVLVGPQVCGALTILLSFLNTSAPFDLHEHNGVWKKPRYTPWGFDKYTDFEVRLDDFLALRSPHTVLIGQQRMELILPAPGSLGE